MGLGRDQGQSQGHGQGSGKGVCEGRCESVKGQEERVSIRGPSWFGRCVTRAPAAPSGASSGASPTPTPPAAGPCPEARHTPFQERNRLFETDLLPVFLIGILESEPFMIASPRQLSPNSPVPKDLG